jgi:protein-disulfide isomerase
MSKQFLGILAAIIIVFIGVFSLTGKKSEAPSGSSNKASLSQHIEGNGSTGVTLVEYGDYQCPYCEQYYPTVKQIQAEFNDQIKFQFRNFPLTSLHPNAFAAARAAEAAALQNKFWEMHDTLYEPTNWQVWTNAKDPTPYFNQFATQLGLNTDQFKKDFGSIGVNNTVNADMAEGNKLGITGTPTFFLDGKKVDITNTPPAFEKVIKAEIAKKALSGSSSSPSLTAAY